MLQWDLQWIVEVWKLVGIYLLGKVSNIKGKEKTGLYRDDQLTVIENANRPKLDHLRKDLIAIFHNKGLKITIDTNLTTTDFLDVTSDLFTGKYFSYGKPNDSPLYVNANSNHPTSILEQLPKTVNICPINEEEFNKAKPLHEKALKSSGFNKNLIFESTQKKPS